MTDTRDGTSTADHVSSTRIARKQSFLLRAFIALAMLAMAQGTHLIGASEVFAANGQCRWEGGAGAAGGYAYCEVEDCLGAGGRAQCTVPEPTTAPHLEGLVGPDKWIYHMCDEGPGHPAKDARWCGSAGGTWVVTPGWNTSCENLPPDVLGGGGTAVSTEQRAVSISDSFAGCSAQSDTGWGSIPASSSYFCWSGRSEVAGIANWETRQRVYATPACNNGLTITLMRQRSVECPSTYLSRTSGGQLQCYRPAAQVCPVSNPVSPVSGAKLQLEVDYGSGAKTGIEFARRYDSGGYFRPLGANAAPFAPVGTRLTTDNWRHNFDRRLYSLTGNAEVAAIAHRHDGTILSFDQIGRQLDNRGGAPAKLEVVPAGGWKLTMGDRTVERYDSAGRLKSIEALDHGTTFLNYDVAGALTSVVGPFGHTLQLGYDTQQRLAVLTLPGGSSVQYAYDSQGRLRSATYPDSTSRLYHYDDPNDVQLLTGITDELGQRYSTYIYDGAGRVTVSEHAGGANRHEFTYYPGSGAAIKDALGTSRTYAFASAGGVLKTGSLSAPGEACGNIKSSTYDTAGNVSLRTDFNDHQTQYEYDLTRNLEVSRTEAFGTPRARTISTTWHAIFSLPAQIDEPGRSTEFTYDPRGNVLTRTVRDTVTNLSRTWTYNYNSAGQVLSIDGPRSDVADTVSFSYHSCTYGNECGQLATVTDASGNETSYLSYNAHGQPLQIEDANGAVTVLTYDSRQRLTSSSLEGEATTYAYWATGLLRKITLPDTSTVNYSYDAAHRLVALSDGVGNYIEYSLDAAGNRVSEQVQDPSGVIAKSLARAFNAAGRLASETSASGHSTEFTTDALGNVISVSDALQRVTTYGYDELNRLAYTADPTGSPTEYGYDALDNLSSVKDPLALVTSYSHNGFGDLTRLTSPDTGITNYTLNAAGNVATATDARNRAGQYSYDASGRLTQLSYPDQTIQFTYDEGPNARGRLSRVNDASGSTHWSYDLKGRVTGKTQVIGSASYAVGYSYNAAGQLDTLTTPSGRTISYEYANNQIVTVRNNGLPILTDVLYEPFGPSRGWTWGNGTLAVRMYDADGNVSLIDSAGLSVYAHDDVNRITGIVDADNSAQSWTYGYDDADRLTSASRSGVTQTFNYDDNGNRLSQGGTTSTTFVHSPTSNRLLSASGALTRTYGYNNAGSVTSNGVASFVYNDAGRTSSATKNGITTAYAYNGLGQRVKKSATAGATYFVYDEAGHLLGEYATNGDLIQEIVWMGDTPVASLRWSSCGLAIFYIHTDHLNTPRRITKRSSPTVVWRWDADPFGTTAANQDPDGDASSFVFNLRLPGQYFDVETGLHYNEYRYYSPETGRYTQSDPIGLYGGMNTYAYVSGNPISNIDPSGLCWSNARAGAHFFGGGGDVSIGQIGCESQISQKVQPHRNMWMSKVKADAKAKAASMRCGTMAALETMRSVGMQSGIFWIRGFSLQQKSNCLVLRNCGRDGNQCGIDTYMFTCALSSMMHDLYTRPTDWDNSGDTANPDFWDRWNYGGTPFYVNGSWSDSVSGSGSLP